MKIHVSELSGAALDWAVAKSIVHHETWICEPFRRGFLKNYHPSSDWAQCGPLIDQYICILYKSDDGFVSGISLDGKAKDIVGENHLIAACRIVVASKMGEEVDIPDELVW